MEKICIIIPAYNEALSLPGVISSLRNQDYDILVIDDCSKDDTQKILSELNANNLHLSINLGIGGAVQAGLKYAKNNGYDVAIQFDGDGQHSAAEIPKLLNGLSEHAADICIGSRWLEPTNFTSSRLRRIGMKFFSFLIYSRIHQKITDPTSGFRAFNRHAIDIFSENYPKDFPEVEIIIESHIFGIKIIEVSTEMNVRQHGESSIGKLKSMYYMIYSLFIVLLKKEK